MRVERKLYWLHVVSNPKLTFYGVHPKRGRAAMDYFDILPRCQQRGMLGERAYKKVLRA